MESSRSRRRPKSLAGLFVALLAAATASPAAWAQGWLSVPQLHENGDADLRFAHDLDGDGDPDLIQLAEGVGSSAGSFRVLLNDGAGSFAAASSFVLPPGTGRHAAFADVTGDGLPDLVCSTTSSNPAGIGVAVYPALGPTAFGPAVHTPTGGLVTALRCGRADADARADVLLLVSSPSPPFGTHLKWWISNGNGTLAAAAGPFQPASAHFSDVAVLDLDGDGLDDVAAFLNSFPTSATLAFVHNAGGMLTPIAGFPVTPAFSTAILVAGDMDADGDPDLLAFCNPTVSTTEQRTFRNGGGGAWTDAGAVPWSFGLGGAIHLADWDADGWPDLFMRGGTYRQLRNLAGTGFQLEYAASLSIGGSYSAGILDVDGDGQADLVGPREVFFGDGTFRDPLGGGSPAAVLADYEDDGDVDLVGYEGESRRNDGRAVFAATQLALPALPINQAYGGDSAFGDFDGDGRNEWIVELFVATLIYPFTDFVEHRRLEDQGDGTLADRGMAASPGTMMHVGLGTIASDADGDGDLDLVSTVGVWRNNGSGFFTHAGNPYSGWIPERAADLDGDGDDDYLAVRNGGAAASVALIRQGPAGVLTLEPLAGSAYSGSNVPSAAVADFDDDGDRDIAWLGGTATGLFWINAGGSFGAPVAVPLAGSAGCEALGGADVDADGRTDLVLGGFSPSRTVIHRRIAPGLSYEAPTTYRGGSNSARLADFDGDGDPDLVSAFETIFGRRFRAPHGGWSRQFGAGNPGTGGMRPVLGRSGPLRVGATTTLRVRDVVGSAPGLLAIGTAESAWLDLPFPGITLYSQPALAYLPFETVGPPGHPELGAADLVFGPLPPWFDGLTLVHQAGVADPGAPYGLAVTNGLECRHGH